MEKIALDTRQKRDDGLFPVILYVRHKAPIRINTGYYAPATFTDHFTKDMDVAWKAKNISLANMLSAVIARVSSLRLNGDLAGMSCAELRDDLRKVLFGDVQKQKKKNLLVPLFSRFISLKSNSRTAEIYAVTMRRILSYQPDVAVGEIDYTWLKRFEVSMSGEGLSVNTIGIQMRNLRAVINYALDEGIIEKYPFRKYRIRREETAHRALTVGQLRTLFTMKLLSHQVKYVDMFRLMFFMMGINVSDLMALKNTDLQNGRITYHRMKTNKLYDIKVEPEAMEIIERYRGTDHLLRFGDQYRDENSMKKQMNKALKKIGDYEEKRKVGGNGGMVLARAFCPDLTTYWARHTWATIAAEIGIPIETIGLCLGHNVGSKITNIYIKYNPAVIDEANRRVMDYVLYGKK